MAFVYEDPGLVIRLDTSFNPWRIKGQLIVPSGHSPSLLSFFLSLQWSSYGQGDSFSFKFRMKQQGTKNRKDNNINHCSYFHAKQLPYLQYEPPKTHVTVYLKNCHLPVDVIVHGHIWWCSWTRCNHSCLTKKTTFVFKVTDLMFNPSYRWM